MFARRSRKRAIRSTIEAALSEPARFAPDKVRADLKEATRTLYFDPADAGAQQIGVVIGMLRKARDWAAVRVESKLLRKIERVSPDILFDIEKKLVFTSNVFRESAAFHQFAEDAFKAWNEARRAGDSERAEQAAASLMTGMTAFITAAENLHHDYASFFGRAVYERYRDHLNTMTVDDRRAVEAFYARFDVAVKRMSRIFVRDIPTAVASDALSGAQIVAWVSALAECIDRLVESAALVLDG